MEEKARGLSLRKKRSVKPKISAPKQISAPLSSSLAQTQNTANYSNPELRPRPPFVSSNNSSSSNISNPKVRGPHGSGSAAGGGGAGGANTADYVKRRYSQRITNLPKDFGDAPSLPSLPTEFLSQPPARAPTRAHSGQGGEKVAVDLKALQDPHLPADQYVARLLANASESDILHYQSDLSKINTRTSTDLQHNVYQNRAQFIKISQEAERLKGEMRSLRNLMSDLTATLAQTNAALGINVTSSSSENGPGTSSSSSSSSSRYARRSSVANLEAMWSTHLHELWRRVEGSQKFLPAIPGRHVLHESGRWVELNTATFKPRRRAHLILLNDHLLVAVEKKRVDPSPNPETSSRLKPSGPTTTQNQLVAERCFPLQDVDIADLAVRADVGSKPAPATANAVSMRVGSDSFTYATTGTSDSGEKAAFLAKSRKAVADLRKLLHVDIDEHASLAAPRQQNSTAATAKQPGGDAPTASSSRASILVEVDGRQQSLRWVDATLDELDMDVALQRFEDAVERVDVLRRVGRAPSNRANAALQDLLAAKLEPRTARLARAIVRQLVETASFAGATRTHVGRLIKLGYEGRAAEAFLEARGRAVRERAGQCVADSGDLCRWVWQVGFVYFRLVRNTVAVWQGAGFAAGRAGAVVVWVKGCVDEFNEVLGRQMGRAAEGDGVGGAGEGRVGDNAGVGGGAGAGRMGENNRGKPKAGDNNNTTNGPAKSPQAEKAECLRIARSHASMLNSVGIDFGNLVGRGMEDVPERE